MGSRKLLQAVLFVAIPLVVIVALELMLRALPNDYRYKKEYFKQHSGKIETLILGNSHAYLGIDPKYIDGHAFNACHLSQSLDYDRLIFDQYINELAQLKMVIIPVSYFSFFHSLNYGETSWFLKNYELYLDLDTPNAWYDNFELRHYSFGENLGKIYDYYINDNNPRICSNHGWGTVYANATPKDLEASGKGNAQRHTYADLSLLQMQTDNLEHIISTCSQKGIKVILITLPGYETYRKYLEENQLYTTLAQAKKIANQFDNCQYLYWLDHPDFVKDDYFDASHLNKKGAEKLSKLLNSYIIENNL